jgi:hypothetical protein
LENRLSQPEKPFSLPFPCGNKLSPHGKARPPRFKISWLP